MTWKRWLRRLTSPWRQYAQIISLGRSCQPAYQIRRLDGGARAHVFDWVLTFDTGLVAFLAENLEGFFARERLQVGSEKCVIDCETKTQFLHEFPAGSDFDVQFEKHAGRYAALVKRWRSLLASRQAVLFVRQHGWDEDPRACAMRLRDVIAARAPRLRFSLLYLTETDEPDWGERGIINRWLRQPTPYVWTGDDAAWQTLLDEASALPPMMRADRGG